ncbi:MAG: HD domain-containing protein [Patescibacteria group bacterium]|jgi:hypothetical protein
MNLLSIISPEDVRLLRNELRPFIGCLKHLATGPEVAVRRIHRDNDGDGIFIGQPGIDPYMIDAALKLMQSRGLRRSARHTQVVPDPTNLHIRTRRSHTDEVCSIAVALAFALGANPWLCLAGALGHDIGHTPLGHTGEMFLAKKTGRSFRHEVFGLVVAQHIERSGHGLNLTKQTLQVMHRHSRGAKDLTTGILSLEEAIVMFADKIAYLFADYNDVIRIQKGGCWICLEESEMAEIHKAMHKLGASQRERVARCIVALVRESAEVGAVSFSRGPTFGLFEEARRHMYKFYPINNPSDHGHAIFGAVYDALAEIMPEVNTTALFALLCDEDLAAIADQLRSRPTPTIKEMLLNELSVSDVFSAFRNAVIDPFDPDLDWEGILDASYSA